MGTRDTYDQSLRELDQKILTMAGHAADAVEHAMDALENSNSEEAQAVIAGDDSIDREEHAIEHLCLGLIASQQPVASDLRKVSTAMKVVTDLERLGDAAEDIAELSIRRGSEVIPELLVLLTETGREAVGMIRTAIAAYAAEDMTLAAEVIDRDDLVDSLAADLYKFWSDSCNTFTTVYGVPPRPTGISITAHAPGGSYTCATPDGRHAGDTLPDGVASPAQGTDVNGPTASLCSAMKINQDLFNAMLLNMKMHPTALKSDDDLKKLGALITTYLTNGGKHIQFNVVDNETLRKAQEKPQDYQDLVVRVAGYSTYFTILTKAVQDEIIARTENRL